MAFVGGLSLGFFFIFMAHSLLVYFLVEDNLNKQVPLKEAFFPWPSKGKIVACVCLVAAFLFAIIAKRGASTFMGMGPDEWKVVGIFIGFPAGWYLLYFFVESIDLVRLTSSRRRRAPLWRGSFL